MNRTSWRLASSLVCLVCLPLAACAQGGAKEGEWVSLFDGKTLSGWKMIENPGQEGKSKWEVVDGALAGSGGASMLYSPKGEYKNFRVRAEIKINDKGNSGFYFRSKAEPGFSGGYEAQVDSTHADPIRTGSLYGFCHVYKQLHKPDEWFTYEIEVTDKVWRGRPMTSIRIRVNGDELFDYMDFAQTHKQGHFAFQHHDPGSKVSIRKVEVMELPSTP